MPCLPTKVGTKPVDKAGLTATNLQAYFDTIHVAGKKARIRDSLQHYLPVFLEQANRPASCSQPAHQQFRRSRHAEPPDYD